MDFLEKLKTDLGAEDILREYRFDRFLGRGGYGRVYEAFNHMEQLPFAIKIFKKSSAASSMSNKLLRNEVDVLKKMRHANVIRIHAYRESSKFIFIITELCAAGDLWRTLQTYQQHFGTKGMAELLVSQIIKQLLTGLKFLQSSFIIHRDLKPENILVKSFENCELQPDSVKIADFGLCKEMHTPLHFSLSAQCGTSNYMAPELLKHSTYSYVD